MAEDSGGDDDRLGDQLLGAVGVACVAMTAYVVYSFAVNDDFQ